MQKLFNKKRKTSHDTSDVADQSAKHPRSNGGDISRPSERQSFEISYKTPVKTSSLRSQKIANLLRSLEDVLDEDAMDETLSLIGEESYNRCMDLKTSLGKHKPLFETLDRDSAPKAKSSRTSLSHDFQNIPKLMSPLSVTPWKSSTISHALPPLPEILDPTLAAATFIHASCGDGIVTDLNYERLEWIGDAYMELVATLLIAQTFPSLNPGKHSQYRERLVKNITLAGYSKEYGFDKRARLPIYLRDVGGNKSREQDLIKVYGDIFESYVAAVILSDPADGVRRAADWLKDVWGRTLHAEIIQEERTRFKFDSPLFRLRGNIDPAQEITIVDKTQVVPLSCKNELQKAIGAKGIRIRYEDMGPPKKDPSVKLPVFTIGIYLDGWGEQNRLLGTGKANGKKEAGENAAEMALKNQKLIKVYMEKKKLADAQAQKLKEALEQHDPICKASLI